MNVETTINTILARRGYILKYEETPASSPEDMYELKVWVEDRNGTKYDYRSIYVRDTVNPKRKAFNLLIDQLVGSYYEIIRKNGNSENTIESC
jgi:hypothetical protein